MIGELEEPAPREISFCINPNQTISVNTLSYKTQSATKESAQKEWLVVDAEGQRLGRLCSIVAKILRGKYKPCFTPHADCGDNVIIINADKIELTGNKWDTPSYLTFSGYPGGQKSFSPRDFQKKSSRKLFEKVLKGMLPKNKLGAELLTHVRVFDGPDHTMEGVQPRKIDINTLK